MLVCGSSDTVLGKEAKKGSATTATQESKKPLPVKAVQVKKADGKQHLDYPGMVLTDNQSKLSFRVSGMVEEFPVKVGQALKKGQLVARLDNDHFINAREQARAAKRRAEVRTRNASSEYQRLINLLSHRDISKQRLQNAKTQAKTAEEDFNIAQKRLAEAERQLSYTILKAPFDGIVASKKIHSFQTVRAGESIVLLVDSSDLLFRVQLPTSLLSRRDDFKKFECIFPALNGQKIEAKLHGVGPSALPPLRTFSLTVELDLTPKLPIMPGTEGILRITASSDTSQNLILVPASAVTGDYHGTPRVWIADPKSKRAHPQAVKLGGLHEGKMSVESGLSLGEWVITAGQAHLNPGQKIKIVKPISGSR
jgi:RND family efflux transporter MFP subunit